MRCFASLRRPADFVRLRQRGRRISTEHLTLYLDGLRAEPQPTVGITVSKSIGKAVVRNKLRRRLAAILHDTLAGGPASALVVVARPGAGGADYCALHAEVACALRRA